MTKNQKTILAVGAVAAVASTFLLTKKGVAAVQKPIVKPSLPPVKTIQNTGSIWLDPGHGGLDPGAVHPTNKTLEKTWTLEASGIISNTLRTAGFRVGASRVSDVSVAPRSNGNWDADRNKRVSNAKAFGSDIFVSLHYDCSSPSCEGTMVYHRDDLQSIALAKAIASALQIESGESTPIRSHTTSRFGGLYIRLFDGPSVLVELGRTGENIDASERKRRCVVVGNAIIQFMRSYNA